MTAKSILDVEVNDQQFARFSELFEKYQAQLAKTPNVWKAVNKESAALATQFERMGAALMAQNEISADTKDAEEKRHKQLISSERLWSSMAKSTKSMAKDALDIGAGILKWGAIVGGGLLGGSLFGIDKMAGGVANSRRSAMGLGLSIGEQKSFNINFERLLDPNFLSQVAEMKMDPTKAGPLYTMGVGTQGSTEDTALALVKAMRQKAVSTPVSMLGLLDSMTGMNAGVEEWRRLHDMKTPEFNSLIAGNRRDVGSIGIDDRTAQKWQEFTTQMERAGATIFKVFVQGLAPLEKPLEHLSASFVKFLETLAKSDLGKEAIEGISSWLESFSGSIAKPEFLSKVEQFTSDVGGLADAIRAIMHPIDAMSTNALSTYLGGKMMDISTWWNKFNNGGAPDKDYLLSLTQGYAQRNQSSYALAAAEMGLESSYGANKGTQPGGATGLFQLKPVWAKYFGQNPDDPRASMDMDTKINAMLEKKYHNDLRAALAAFHLGETTFDPIYNAHKRDFFNYLPQESQDYVNKGAKIIVSVQNNTGGSSHVAVNSLAGGQ